MNTDTRPATCDQTLYATGEPCGRSTNLIAGFDSRGQEIARCKRHAKPGYGFHAEPQPDSASVADFMASLR